MTAPTIIIYDGECPFCSRYVEMLRLKEAVGAVELRDARTPDPLVDRLKAEGVDFNAGMAVQHGERLYHGPAAIQWLSLMTTSSASFNGLMAWVFKGERRSRLLYPVLRAGRRLLLTLMGRSLIDDRRDSDRAAH